MVTFKQLNHGWNADPNAPEPLVSVDGSELQLTFYVNTFQFPGFAKDSKATIRFKSCKRYRLGPTNDEGWHMGQCRFGSMAPAWGEFYQISGDSELLVSPPDWVILGPQGPATLHYLFYLKDETFECLADSWELRLQANNSFKPTPLRGAA